MTKGYILKVTASALVVICTAHTFAQVTSPASLPPTPEGVYIDLTKIGIGAVSLIGFIFWWASDRKSVEMKLEQHEKLIAALEKNHEELRDNMEQIRRER